MDDHEDAHAASLNPRRICGCTRPGGRRLDRARGYSELCHQLCQHMKQVQIKPAMLGDSLSPRAEGRVDARDR